MHTIPFPHKANVGDEQASSEENHEIVHPFPHEVNITDGGEFLDDGIRMKDQPFEEHSVKTKE
jgi:hypothetical protein